MSSPRSTQSLAPWGAYRTTLTGADPEASDDDSAFTCDDMDSMESELLLLDLEDSDQLEIATLDCGDGCRKKDASSPAISEQPDRVRSIDLLRGISTLGMVLVHFLIYYGNEAAMGSMLYFVMNNVLGNVGAAGFLALAGMSHPLAVDGRIRKAAAAGRTWWECDELRCAWRRSLKLLSVELLMLALAWGPRDMIKWDILTLQATSTLVLYVCRRVPSQVVALLAICIALATPALRSLPVVDFAAAWGGGFRESPFSEKFAPGLVYDPVAGDLEARWDFKSIAQGYLLTGIFPLFPWLLFPLVGNILGRRVKSNQFQHDLVGVGFMGMLFFVMGMGGALFSCSLPDANIVTDYLSPLSFYPDSFTMVLVQMGYILVVIPVAFYYYDVRNKVSTTVSSKESGAMDAGEPLLHRVLYLTSRWALPIYFLHYICIGWPLAVHAYLRDGRYPIFDWMDAGPALLAGLVAVVGLLGLMAMLENASPRACLRLPKLHRSCRSRPADQHKRPTELYSLEDDLPTTHFVRRAILVV
jgi:uncharacterized membrane protein